LRHGIRGGGRMGVYRWGVGASANVTELCVIASWSDDRGCRDVAAWRWVVFLRSRALASLVVALCEV
jgi:hypothetical protein